MSDPRIARAIRSIAQSDVRSMVERVLRDTDVTGRILRGEMSPVENALVRAVYNPDKRLGGDVRV